MNSPTPPRVHITVDEANKIYTQISLDWIGEKEVRVSQRRDEQKGEPMNEMETGIRGEKTSFYIYKNIYLGKINKKQNRTKAGQINKSATL